MTSQVLFKIDSKLKKAIQTRATRESLTLSDVFKMTGRAYAEGQIDLGVIPQNIPVVKATKRDLAEIARAKEDIRKGNFRPWSEVRDELDRKYNFKR